MRHNKSCKLTKGAFTQAYFESLSELVIGFLRSSPFGLAKREAELCAQSVMKIIQQNVR